MLSCSNCGQMSDDSELFCDFCGTELTRVRCFLAIENVYRRKGLVNTNLGDVFLTDAGIYYLSYTDVDFDDGAVGGVLANAIGEGLTHSIWKHAKVEEDIAIASRTREKDRGLSIPDRSKTHRSISISEKDVTSFVVDNDLIVIHTIQKKSFQFQVYEISKHRHKLTNYSKGERWIDRNDYSRHGFGYGLPSPAIFLNWLVSNPTGPRFSNEMLSRVTQNDNYMNELWKEFSKRNDQALILNSIAMLPKFFGLKFSGWSTGGELIKSTTSGLGFARVGAYGLINGPPSTQHREPGLSPTRSTISPDLSLRFEGLSTHPR